MNKEKGEKCAIIPIKNKENNGKREERKEEGK